MLRRVTLVVGFATALVTGCGGDGGRDVGPDRPTEESASAIRIEDSRLTYLPDQTGGRFHTALVLLRNTSDKVALNVGGQLSVMDGGQLVESVNPTEVNILPGGRGLILEEALDLPKPLKNGTLEMRVSVGELREGPSRSPIAFSDLKFTPGGEDGFAPCSFSGRFQNTFKAAKSDLQIRVAGFANDRLVAGGFTYVDQVFPGQEATFEIEPVSPAECPEGVDRVEALPNLGEDKIFDGTTP